jgi:hypothetical protein
MKQARLARAFSFGEVEELEGNPVHKIVWNDFGPPKAGPERSEG